MPVETGPTFRPNGRIRPRIMFSMSSTLPSSALRPASSIRSACASRDLTWTDRNQPVRINCAMPRASFLSVLFSMALSAALVWRVSMQTIGKPLSSRAA